MPVGGVGSAGIDLASTTSAALERSGRRLIDVVTGSRAGATARVLRGDRAPADELRGELGPPGCAALLACGVLREEGEEGEEVSSPFRGHLVAGRIVFSDPDVPDDEQDPLYLDPLWEAELLTRLMLPHRGARALDVGCGCGVLSLALATGYEQVIGIDINPRALEMTRLNCTLNGVRNVDLAPSDMYGGINGRFDRIVFNSPTNEEGAEFWSLLETGEGILERFFSGLPDRLTLGGLAEVNLAMNDYPGSRFVDRLGRWLGLPESGVDALVLRSLRTDYGNGHKWQRGWLLATQGTGRIATVDWPYHEAAEDPAAPLARTVEHFLASAPAVAADGT